MFFINLPIAKFMRDTAYLAITYWKRVNNYLGTSEGSILNVHRSDGFGIWFNYLDLGEGFFAEVGWSKKCCQTKSYLSYWDGK
jgi:hypothetical protein